MKKNIILIIVVVCLLIVALFFMFKPSNEPKVTNSYDITIIVYDSENNEIYNQKNKVMEDKLLDSLKTAVNLDISTKINDSDEYVTGINGYMENDNYRWNYYVNDEKATVGEDKYEIKNNDIITFRLEEFE